MAANLHIMSYTYSDTALFSYFHRYSLSLTCGCIDPLSPSNPFSPYYPSTPLHRQWCQTSVYVIILIVLLTSHDCFGDGRQKRAPGQVTKRSIETHLARLGRTHRPASNPLSPSREHPLDSPRYHPHPPWLCRRANTYTDVDPYMRCFSRYI